MVDVDPEQAQRLAELACPAPAADSPQSMRPPPDLCARPPPDCTDDEAIAAMYQAQYDAEVAQMIDAQKKAQEDDDDEAWIDEMLKRGVEEELSGLTVEECKERCDVYRRQTDFLNKLIASVDESRNVSVVPNSYGFSDDEEAHELTEAFLDGDDNDPVMGVPVTSNYFVGTNMFEPLVPSPVKQPRKKPRGPIKIPPEESSEDEAPPEQPESAPCSQTPAYEIQPIEAID